MNDLFLRGQGEFLDGLPLYAILTTLIKQHTMVSNMFLQITDQSGNTFTVNKSNIIKIETIHNSRGEVTRITTSVQNKLNDVTYIFTNEKYDDIIKRLYLLNLIRFGTLCHSIYLLNPVC